MTNIEIGKFYKTRCGLMVRIYATDGGGERSIHGAYRDSQGNWRENSWTTMGHSFTLSTNQPWDIISEWIEKPIFDWDKQSPWFNFAAMDENGKWYLFSTRPEINGVAWFTDSSSATMVPAKYEPKFNGNWKDSLIERPKS